jgi:hypothetical protein
MNDEDRDRALVEAANTVNQAQQMMEKERQSHKALLAKKLAEKRARRAKLRGEPIPGEEIPGEEKPDTGKEDATTSEADASHGAADEPTPAKTKPLGVLPTSQGDIDSLLKKVKAIEAVVATNPVVKPYYIDEKDAQWQNSSQNVHESVLDPKSQLSSKECVALDFGARQARLLSTHWNLPVVTVLPVNDLPAEVDWGNAFRRSYRYNQTTHELYVRRARLEEPGAFLMMMLHAMAHVKVGSTTYDETPEFTGAFYDGLKQICKQLVKSRSRVQGDVSALVSEVAKEAAEAGSREAALKKFADLEVSPLN